MLFRRCGYKPLEQRVGLIGTGFEFRMILNADIKRSFRYFNCLNKSSVRRGAAYVQTSSLNLITIVIVEFITMTVSFGNFVLTVETFHRRAVLYLAGVAAKTERAALIDFVALTGHKINDLMSGIGIEFA